jgi:hypothetical protein
MGAAKSLRRTATEDHVYQFGGHYADVGWLTDRYITDCST